MRQGREMRYHVVALAEALQLVSAGVVTSTAKAVRVVLRIEILNGCLVRCAQLLPPFGVRQSLPDRRGCSPFAALEIVNPCYRLFYDYSSIRRTTQDGLADSVQRRIRGASAGRF